MSSFRSEQRSWSFFVTVATVENVFCLHSPKDGNILKGMKCDRKDLGSRSLWNYAIKGG